MAWLQNRGIGNTFNSIDMNNISTFLSLKWIFARFAYVFIVNMHLAWNIFHCVAYGSFQQKILNDVRNSLSSHSQRGRCRPKACTWTLCRWHGPHQSFVTLPCQLLLAEQAGLNHPRQPMPREPINRKQECLLFIVYCGVLEGKSGETLSSQSTKRPVCAVGTNTNLGHDFRS